MEQEIVKFEIFDSHVEIIFDKGSIITAEKSSDLMTTRAAKHGMLEALLKLHQSGCRVSIGTMINAAKFNHTNIVECLEILIGFGIEPNVEVMNAAAASNNLKCLEFLYKQGCLYERRTLLSAASSGSLDCLVFLFKIKCPFSEYVLDVAKKNNHVSCVEFMTKLGVQDSESYHCALMS